MPRRYLKISKLLDSLGIRLYRRHWKSHIKKNIVLKKVGCTFQCLYMSNPSPEGAGSPLTSLSWTTSSWSLYFVILCNNQGQNIDVLVQKSFLQFWALYFKISEKTKSICLQDDHWKVQFNLEQTNDTARNCSDPKAFGKLFWQKS